MLLMKSINEHNLTKILDFPCLLSCLQSETLRHEDFLRGNIESPVEQETGYFDPTPMLRPLCPA